MRETGIERHRIENAKVRRCQQFQDVFIRTFRFKCKLRADISRKWQEMLHCLRNIHDNLANRVLKNKQRITHLSMVYLVWDRQTSFGVFYQREPNEESTDRESTTLKGP